MIQEGIKSIMEYKEIRTRGYGWIPKYDGFLNQDLQKYQYNKKKVKWELKSLLLFERIQYSTKKESI